MTCLAQCASLRQITPPHSTTTPSYFLRALSVPQTPSIREEDVKTFLTGASVPAESLRFFLDLLSSSTVGTSFFASLVEEEKRSDQPDQAQPLKLQSSSSSFWARRPPPPSASCPHRSLSPPFWPP